MQRKKFIDVGKKQKSVSPITKIYRSRSRTENKRIILKPKSIGKSQKIMNNKDHGQKTKQEKKMKSAQEIILMVSSLDIQHLSFDQLWNQFLSIVIDYLKINVIFPAHFNQIGEEILKDGRFILSWLKIIQKNGYVIQQIICKHVLEKYLPKLQKQQKELSIYVNEKMERLMALKSAKKTTELKRSIIKNSQKKVRFSQKRQIYPPLEQYKTPENYSAFKKTQIIKVKNKLLFDNFYFEKIFSLDKIEIVGVLKQYEKMFAVMIGREKNINLEYICIGVISQNVYNPEDVDKTKKIIEDVKRQFTISGYIELEGRQIGEIWINSLPDQRI